MKLSPLPYNSFETTICSRKLSKPKYKLWVTNTGCAIRAQLLIVCGMHRPTACRKRLLQILCHVRSVEVDFPAARRCACRKTNKRLCRQANRCILPARFSAEKNPDCCSQHSINSVKLLPSEALQANSRRRPAYVHVGYANIKRGALH